MSCLESIAVAKRATVCFLAMDSFNYLATMCFLAMDSRFSYLSAKKRKKKKKKPKEGGGKEEEQMNQLVDVLRDEAAKEDPIFKKATSCLVNSHPETLLETRDQRSTNACVSFVVTACMYGEEIFRTSHAVEASPQEIHDYHFFHKRPSRVLGEGEFEVPPRGFESSFQRVFSYVMTWGVSPARFYPWVNGTSRFSICHGRPWDGKITNREDKTIPRDRKIFIGSYREIVPVIPKKNFDSNAVRGSEGYELINAALDNQPLTGCIIATAEFIILKGDEIYKPDTNDGAMHAITLVGYGQEGDDDYFIFQNSWGIGWAKLGYGRVLRKAVTRIYAPENAHIPHNVKRLQIWKKRRLHAIYEKGDGTDCIGLPSKKQK